mmetsp:Transcript_8463/g.27642  ORF Transcript_8463/g.27642 Transcript_8463/m.27642 type:complete len:149 (+) Transcript_8463:807-1253(+)
MRRGSRSQTLKSRSFGRGRVSMVEFAAGEVHAGSTSARVLLPGSFNPLHEGHVSLLAAARAAAGGGNASLELSVGNVDKGFLPKEEIERRVEGILAAGVPVVVTNAPLFATKAEYFPGSTFVVCARKNPARAVKVYLQGNASQRAPLT